MTARSHTGQCHCGETVFEATGSPLFSVYCHCSLCQATSGSPFVGWVGFSDPGVTITRGAEKLVIYNSPDGLARHSCGTCSAAIFAGGAFPPSTPPFKMVALSLFPHEGSVFDADIQAKGHIFYPSRMMNVSDGLPKWTGFPGTELVSEV